MCLFIILTPVVVKFVSIGMYCYRFLLYVNHLTCNVSVKRTRALPRVEKIIARFNRLVIVL